MNLEDLRSAQTRERATDGLQDLRDSFYGDVADYIQELKDRRDAAAEAADDPFGDPEVQELTDKIETAEQVAEAIYERRMGKLVKQASLAAAGMPDDEDGLTAEERDLYADIVDRIESNKAHVLEVISGDAESTGGEDSTSDSGASRSDSGAGTGQDGTESSAAAAMGGGLNDADGAATAADGAAADAGPASESDAESPDGEPPADDDPSAEAEPPDAIAEDLARVAGDEADDDPTTDGGVQSETSSGDGGPDADDRVRVRVTDDVGEIFGVDERPYDLEAEDVVTLPAANAEPLVQKDAAERLE